LTVFTALAQNAASLCRRPVLARLHDSVVPGLRNEDGVEAESEVLGLSALPEMPVEADLSTWRGVGLVGRAASTGSCRGSRI